LLTIKKQEIMKKIIIIITILGPCFWFTSCEDYLEVPLPVDQLATESVFKSKSTIEASVIGLYSSYAGIGSASDFASVTYLSDELYYPVVAGGRDALAIANIDASNSMVNSWGHYFTAINRANILTENLPGVSAGVLKTAERDRYLGEAKYIRAATYLFLVNFWGEVPLVLSSSLNDNLRVPRVPVSQIYDQITQDLKDAVLLLPATVTADPNRIHNKYQAEALLARVYLYRGLWAEAETAANNVITNNGYYALLPNLADVFKRNSKEIIFSTREILQVSLYLDKSYYGVVLLADVNHAIHPSLVEKFETGDARFTNWTRSVSGRRQAFKYVHSLIASATANPQDFVVQRFAELYLIRAEARAQQNKLTGPNGAIADINAIRTRAALGNTAAVTQAEVLAAIEDERIRELIGECHRWFDLKRTNKADQVLGALAHKAPNYKPHMKFMPISTREIDSNPALIQTSGYN
jgi:starch-binding outer membrane protein, SusD/RagB family